MSEPGQQIAERKFVDAGQRGQSEDNLRSVLGIVNTQTGAILSGQGFSVAFVSAGVVDVTWTKVFTRIPTISLGFDDNGGTARGIFLRNTTTTSVRIVTIDISGNANGAIAHFRAEAPW